MAEWENVMEGGGFHGDGRRIGLERSCQSDEVASQSFRATRRCTEDTKFNGKNSIWPSANGAWRNPWTIPNGQEWNCSAWHTNQMGSLRRDNKTEWTNAMVRRAQISERIMISWEEDSVASCFKYERAAVSRDKKLQVLSILLDSLQMAAWFLSYKCGTGQEFHSTHTMRESFAHLSCEMQR